MPFDRWEPLKPKANARMLRTQRTPLAAKRPEGSADEAQAAGDTPAGHAGFDMNAAATWGRRARWRNAPRQHVPSVLALGGLKEE